eukprot:8791646-Alexandrium_andersonii.AAC.1
MCIRDSPRRVGQRARDGAAELRVGNLGKYGTRVFSDALANFGKYTTRVVSDAQAVVREMELRSS